MARSKTGWQIGSTPRSPNLARSLTYAISRKVTDNLRPRPTVCTKTWAEEKIERIPGNEKTIRVDFSLFPHVIEPLKCFDDPSVNRVTLQWGAQLGKTFFSQLILASTLANNPFPAVFADMNEDAVIRVFKRLWPLLDQIPQLADVLPPRDRRKNNFIETSVGVIHGAWAGSTSKAKDYGAKIVVLNEADGMIPESTRSESDFRLAIEDRTLGYQNFKIIAISTPSIAGESYIEAQRLLGDNRMWHVPCPHCNHFQRWKTGNGKDPGGLKWDRLADGRHLALLAKETAWYECESCRGRIEESHRAWMCRNGIWVPEGCTVKDNQLQGQPVRPGAHASFGPPHLLTSLLPGITMGSVAEMRVNCLNSTQKSEAQRRWYNSIEGVTWDPAPEKTEPALIQVRMESKEDHPGVCPEWTRFLTTGVDVSAMGPTDFQFHTWTSAWGLGQRGGLVDMRTILGRKAFMEWVFTTQFPVANRMGRYRPSRILIDSGDGDMTASIYALCDMIKFLLPKQPQQGSKNILVSPIKGSSSKKDDEEQFTKNDAGLRLSKGAFRGEDKAWLRKLKERARQYDLVLVNTHLSQAWIEDRIQGRVEREHPMWYSIPSYWFVMTDTQKENLIRHMTGDYQRDGKWVKRYNDQHYRDGWRYSAVAADQHTKDGREWDSVADTVLLETAAVREYLIDSLDDRGLRMPDGREFLPGNR
ncbi:MAG: hypothetical protein E6R03_14205 [Hyphomicrobiaceae bacterium]|nr:MAG: hypothetical protein E6R03_14205 [Hyphomicrobiaceae bacterium]